MGGPRPGLCAQRPVGAGLGPGGGSSVSRGGMRRYHFIPEKRAQSPSTRDWFLLSGKEVALLSRAPARQGLGFPQGCSETVFTTRRDPEGLVLHPYS